MKACAPTANSSNAAVRLCATIVSCSAQLREIQTSVFARGVCRCVCVWLLDTIKLHSVQSRIQAAVSLDLQTLNHLNWRPTIIALLRASSSERKMPVGLI
jgi:hypothetical protein